MKAILYARFSPRPHAEDCDSCERQIADLRAWCKAHNHEIVGEFQDRALSGGDDWTDNLRWATHLENIADKRTHGTMASGDRHGKTKVGQDVIDAILALRGMATQKEVAKRFGLSRGYVGQLWSGNRKRVTA